jgi:hypothetical protein
MTFFMGQPHSLLFPLAPAFWLRAVRTLADMQAHEVRFDRSKSEFKRSEQYCSHRVPPRVFTISEGDYRARATRNGWSRAIDFNFEGVEEPDLSGQREVRVDLVEFPSVLVLAEANEVGSG